MNKWWLVGTAVLLLTVVAADAKKKWKSDEDFEFEEVRGGCVIKLFNSNSSVNSPNQPPIVVS